MKPVSIVIPVAPYHMVHAEQAIAAARSQSLPCEVITVMDTEGRGAGAARNRGVAQVKTPLVYFLDADDTIRLDTIERMIGYYQRGKYVYSDDQQGDSIHQTPDCGAYLDGSWHTVNALVPTALVRAAGGFDEQLLALEDLDFFLRLQAHGFCGVRCPHVLVSYSDLGQRSKLFVQQSDYKQRKQAIYKQWSGRAKMACGCQSGAQNQQVVSQEGDVLARALYSPRQVTGTVTGRLYPKPVGFQNYVISVDPRDLASAKGREMWEAVKTIDPLDVAPAIDEVMALAREVMSGRA